MAERHEGGGQIAAARPSAVADAEDVLIRNHDFQWGYDLELSVVAADGSGAEDVDVADADGSAVVDGRPVHEERYYLQPGATRSEFDVFESGEYEVRVVLDGCRTDAARVSVDHAEDGVLIELGNGAVSVQDGLYE
jgi:hypothetical protein